MSLFNETAFASVREVDLIVHLLSVDHAFMLSARFMRPLPATQTNSLLRMLSSELPSLFFQASQTFFSTARRLSAEASGFTSSAAAGAGDTFFCDGGAFGS